MNALIRCAVAVQVETFLGTETCDRSVYEGDFGQD